jgi:hypothetical protein
MRKTRMKKLALLLSLLALGALGLVACGGGDDDDSATTATATPETTTEPKLSRERAQELMAKLSPGQVRKLKAKLSREQLQELKREANVKAKLSREQVRELTRKANDWASLFATDACNKYTGQPQCGRLICRRDAVGPRIENCTPVSAAFKKSFADATVEDIKSERIALVGWTDRPYYEAAVKFSNGEVVVFGGVPGPEPPDGSCGGAGSGCVWNVAEPNHNRRFFEAAAPLQ